ncbi:phage tail-like protein [Kitasatospora sp. MAP12-15]|uniref:phage tail protein n=1 Tax=unclassified Kitasatospora TaxID=2633591 RepID=UPI00247646CF|nr:phage tail protein [Kitasatospora sp. MAP12-44]MDH6113642.1 phage tail-like protein [Kitasatospora sp. MAP12-44]
MSGQDPGTTVHFRLQVTGIDLGVFNTCSGLGAQVEVEQRPEGGNNGFVWQLPTRVTYPNVTMSRGVTPDSAKIATYLTALQQRVTRGTAQITALDSKFESVIATWSLRDAIMVRWSGPSFDPNRSEVASESIELAYHGFL